MLTYFNKQLKFESLCASEKKPKQLLMSELLNTKCRYLAEFKVFQDLDSECKSNYDFIDFIHSTLAQTSYQISKEIETRTFEREHLKSPLSREIREELINFVSALNSNTIEGMNSFLDTTKKQLLSLKERTKVIINNSKEFLQSAQSYYSFYKGKLNKNIDEIQQISTTIKQLNKQQVIKTKELEGRGKSLDKIEINKFQSKKEVLTLQISNLEKSNKRFRSDVHIQTERLGNSYEHLTNTLIKELKRSEQLMVDIISKLICQMEPFLNPLVSNNSIVNQAHFNEINNMNRQNYSPKNIVFSPPKEQVTEDLCLPTFPGKDNKDIGQQLDSLFFSKSIDQ